jgi:hypothetical protein
MEEYKKNWGYVDSMIGEANRLGFSPAMIQLAASKWAGEGGRKPRVGSLGLSKSENRIEYPDMESELKAYRSSVQKILGSKGYNVEQFDNSSAEELFNALQYRPEGEIAGKDYYMYNNVRGDKEYKKLITGTPEYRHFDKRYIEDKKNSGDNYNSPMKLKYKVPSLITNNSVVNTEVNTDGIVKLTPEDFGLI